MNIHGFNSLAGIKSAYILYIFALALAVTSCENDSEEIAKAARKENFPVETAANIKVIYSDSAKMKATMNAPLLKRYVEPDAYVELPKGVELVFYDDNMNRQSTITADYAISREGEKKMEAKNNVVVVNEKGETLKTEHLIWDEKTRMIYSTAFATITTRDETIYGNGFEANESFSKYKIKDVKGILNAKTRNNAPHP